MNKKFLLILLFCCCLNQVIYSSDEGDENRDPNPNIPQIDKKRIHHQIGADLSTAPLLKSHGPLTEETLQKLRNQSSTEIRLYLASGKNGSYFYNNRLIVSPEVINPNVQKLSLIICRLRNENIKYIGKFDKLEELNLSTNVITDEAIESISQLKSLRILNLHSNEIGDKFLEQLADANMSNLRELDVSCNSKVTDEGNKHIIEKMPALEKLHINCNKISEGMYKKIKQERPNLEIEYFPG